MSDVKQKQSTNRLYIGKLPHAATKEQLAALFGQFGEIVSIDIHDNQGKHYAFIEYPVALLLLWDMWP